MYSFKRMASDALPDDFKDLCVELMDLQLKTYVFKNGPCRDDDERYDDEDSVTDEKMADLESVPFGDEIDSEYEEAMRTVYLFEHGLLDDSEQEEVMDHLERGGLIDGDDSDGTYEAG